MRTISRRKLPREPVSWGNFSDGQSTACLLPCLYGTNPPEPSHQDVFKDWNSCRHGGSKMYPALQVASWALNPHFQLSSSSRLGIPSPPQHTHPWSPRGFIGSWRYPVLGAYLTTVISECSPACVNQKLTLSLQLGKQLTESLIYTSVEHSAWFIE